MLQTGILLITFLTIIFLDNVFTPLNRFQLSFYLILFCPLVLSVFNAIKNKKISIPINITITYLLFIIFSLISTFLAIDSGLAIEKLLIYIASYIVLIIIYNYQEAINQYLEQFILGISIFSSLLFLVNKLFSLKIFEEGAGLFYDGYYHNELGVILILGIIICIYKILINNYNQYFYLLMFLLPFFIISYSRSAYLSIIFVCTLLILINNKYIDKNKKKVIILLISLITIFFFLTTKEIKSVLPKATKTKIEQILPISNKKTFFGKRLQHFDYSLQAINQHLLFGVGIDNLNNFTISKQFNWQENTTTSHNMILDILAENGLLASLSFVFFLFIVIKNSINNHNLFSYLFWSLTAIFLFNFSYQFSFILFLWFVLIGRVITNEQKLKVSSLFIIGLALMIFLFGQLIFISNLLMFSGYNSWSQFVYPLNDHNYRMSIQKNLSNENINQALINLARYDQYFPNGYHHNFIKAQMFEKLDKHIALRYYQQIIYEKPLSTSNILHKIIQLNHNLLGNKEGNEQTQQYVNKLIVDLKVSPLSDVGKIIRYFCYDYKLKCLN